MNRPFWFGVLLFAAVAALFAPAVGYPYVHWDDTEYIARNPVIVAVRAGDWWPVLTEPVMGNHHPVTMFSIALEEVLLGGRPAVRHAVNVLVHAVNAVLAFGLLRLLLANHTWAFIIALLWAVHPMRVESVAWVSARKDVLMMCFGLSAAIAWLRWRSSSAWPWYAAALLAFVLACGSKAMAVAIVPSLLLVDAWQGRGLAKRSTWLPVVPFLAVAIAVGLLAVGAQADVGVVNNVGLTGAERIMVASANLVFYTAQQAVPLKLGVFYGYPHGGHDWPWFYPLFAALGLPVMAWLVLARRWRGSWVSLGAGLMVLNLFLVLQWLPVGEAIRADRYTYAAGLGFSLMLGAALRGLVGHPPKPWAAALVVVAVPAYAALTWLRLPLWSAPENIWTEMIAQEPRRYWHYTDRAITYEQLGLLEQASKDHDRAVKRAGNDLKPMFERGMFNIRHTRYRQAMADLLTVYQRQPAYPGLLANMLYAQLKLGLCQEVIGNATLALASNPNDADVLNMRAYCLLKAGRPAEAAADIDRSLALRRGYAEIHFLNGWRHLLQGDKATACAELRLSGASPFSDPDLAAERKGLAEVACP